jgi:thioredoxin 1
MNKTTTSTLDRDLTATAHVILDFGSPGCAPCKKVPVMLEELLASLEGAAVAAFEVDITEEPAIAQRFFVLGVPTLIVFRDGREVARFNALPKKEKLLSLLKS